MRKSGDFGRRAFLQGVGGTALCLPFLSSLSTVRAADARPKRLVIVFYSHGTIDSSFKPAATGALGTLPALLAPFEPYKAKMNVLSGMDNIVRALNTNSASGGHSPAARTLLTCQPFQGVKQGQQPKDGPADGPSIDWVIGPKLKGGMPRAVVNLGITDSPLDENGLFFVSAGEAATLLTNPKNAADTLFAGVGNATSDAPKTPAELYASRKKSIVTSVAESVKRLSSRVANEDRARLQAHLHQVEGLESLIGASVGGVACMKPALGLPGDYSPKNISIENTSAAAQIENAVMTLACNVAPVVTLQFVEYQNPNFQFLFNGDTTEVLKGATHSYTGWHAMVHEARAAKDAQGVSHLTTGFTFYMQQVANLWKRLNEVEDAPGQTLAQNTLVLAVSEFGDGAAHITKKLPVVLLGDLGGKVKTGQHRDCSGYTTGDLFTTLQAILTGDTTEFGMTGNLPQQNASWPFDTDGGRPYHKGLLPGLT
jgi:hypothetical protein